MTDDVLCVRVSPNGKLLAASLLDSTVRVRCCRAIWYSAWALIGMRADCRAATLASEVAAASQPAAPPWLHGFDPHCLTINCTAGVLCRLPQVLPVPLRPQAAGAQHGHLLG